MNNKAHDLFLLILNLRQFKSREKILGFFLAAMGNMWQNLDFSFDSQKKDDTVSTESGREIIAVATRKRRFGVITVQGKSLDSRDMPLIRNAVSALAIIMENREQENLLADEKVHLEEAVRERTAELIDLNDQLKRRIEEQKRLESQLSQARKMEAVGTMAGGIAHDFNNILGAIVGYSELCKLKIDENHLIQHYLSQILKVADRARDTVSQILSFSRESGLERRPVLLEPLIHETVKMLRTSLPASIELRKIPGDYSRAVSVNPGEIRQVIMNLCVNAAEAMKDGDGKAVLEIQLKEINEKPEGCIIAPEENTGPFLRLTIRDTGPGIKPVILERMFEPFFTTRERGLHSGMGLAVVHGIVKGYGGDILVESIPGKGSAFHIFLPSVQPLEEQQFEKIPDLQHLPRGRETILLVDDDAALADACSQTLEELGYSVMPVTGSQEALKVLKQAPDKFQLIITDYSMPRMTGLQLAQKIRVINREVPIILCTGYSDPVERSELDKFGIHGIVHKPFSISNLSGVIRDVFD